METKIATKPYLVESPKGWYIYLSVRDPRTGKMYPKKIEKGFAACLNAAEKRIHAQKLIKEYTQKIKNGWVPWRDEASIYEDEVNYHRENITYSKKRKAASTVRRLLSDFLSIKKTELKKKSYLTYQSKVRIFNQFIDRKNYSEYDITMISNKIILDFFDFLITTKGLDKTSIKNYKTILSCFFNYLLKRKLILKTPIYDIPKARKIKDHAPRPILQDDLKLLLSTIEKKDPQLYLACLMQFFCAIRPGVELRLLKIKHIDFWSQVININMLDAKVEQERTINIPDQLLQLITKTYKLQNYNKEMYIFSQDQKPGDTPLGINNFRMRFNYFRDNLELSKDYKFYSLKHTGAGMLLDTGQITIKDLQEHLGHTDINSTFHYIRKYKGNTTNKIRENFPNPYDTFKV